MIIDLFTHSLAFAAGAFVWFLVARRNQKKVATLNKVADNVSAKVKSKF